MSALTAAALHIARPFMSAWAAWRDDELSSMPRPSGLPRAVADGPSADRILLIGSGPAVGWGVASHDLALPGALARALRATTGRGAIVDVIADPQMTAANLAGVLVGTRLDRYDAVVTTVGTNDALHFTTPLEWRRRIARALDLWSSRARGGTTLLMVGIIPLRLLPTFTGVAARSVDRLSLVLNRVTDEIVEQHPTVRTTLLPAPAGGACDALGRFTPEGYEFWAAQLAAELVEHLDELAGDLDRTAEIAERMTTGVDDADRIAELLSDDATSLERIVTIAAAAFHTPTALVTVLGPDTQWHVSRFGIDLESLPIEQSFCAVAVRTDDGMVVPDATHDPRFARNPLVTGAAQVRYYVGVPIEDPQGRRIGALCVVDTKPRNVTTDADLSMLRSLAEKVQRIVWASVERAQRTARGEEPPHSRVLPEHVDVGGRVETLPGNARVQVAAVPRYRPATLVAAVG
ncbi:GAF domain-containing protein [Microcella humidisoli]|uniref:GAF domain-containing protein n=1 Tax=Microcella humidisoli TaxID=2963406 RepID=A0ABY5FUH3_9MICO|nr:GAF domain-containing protein [Microcella humidisoli]UTT61762.1 GAF domain-containing protein [Microcella humidisoli]